MAGNYPDAPSWRMAYDRDGTQLYTINSANVITQLSVSDMTTLNDESDSSYTMFTTNNSGYLVFIFPELRDIDAVFVDFQYSTIYGQPNTFTAQVSVDTTNGLDGTWSTISISRYRTQVKPAFRSSISSSTALAVRAIRFYCATTSGDGAMFSAVHLYGEPAPGENPHRLALWHPTLDQRVSPAYFDWGNVPRNSSGDRQFRVKNLSTSQSASSIRVAMEALTDANPSVVSQHTISMDGSTFLPQVNIGALGPGAISGILTLRRVTPSNAVLSLWSFRVFAESSTWS